MRKRIHFRLQRGSFRLCLCVPPSPNHCLPLGHWTPIWRRHPLTEHARAKLDLHSRGEAGGASSAGAPMPRGQRGGKGLFGTSIRWSFWLRRRRVRSPSTAGAPGGRACPPLPLLYFGSFLTTRNMSRVEAGMIRSVFAHMCTELAGRVRNSHSAFTERTTTTTTEPFYNFFLRHFGVEASAVIAVGRRKNCDVLKGFAFASLI